MNYYIYKYICSAYLCLSVSPPVYFEDHPPLLPHYDLLYLHLVQDVPDYLHHKYISNISLWYRRHQPPGPAWTAGPSADKRKQGIASNHGDQVESQEWVGGKLFQI